MTKTTNSGITDMTHQTITTLRTASKSKTTMIIEDLLALSEQAGSVISDEDYDKLHQAFYKIETKMLKQKRLVRLYPNWEVSALSHGK